MPQQNRDSPASSWMERRMKAALDERRRRGTLRTLQYDANFDGEAEAPKGSSSPQEDTIDFSSNDYLGLAQDSEQIALSATCVSTCYWSPSVDSHSSGQETSPATGRAPPLRSPSSEPLLGATGSRLLSGDSPLFHHLEAYLASVHRRPAAVLCNSGYDANLSVVSTLLCQRIVYDEYVHNSLHMGVRLWKSASSSSSTISERRAVSFRHNSVQDLEHQLQLLSMALPLSSEDTPPAAVVLIESVYSMDGDVAPVQKMLDLCHRYSAMLVVDEAHGLGVFGRPPQPGLRVGTGVLAQQGAENHPALLCSIHTFGKAAGCHGAVVCGSRTLKQYIVNYAYPFIYSTALPVHSLVAIWCAYKTMTGPKGDDLRKRVFARVEQFREAFRRRIRPRLLDPERVYLLQSESPIQALMIPGNKPCTDFCRILSRLSHGRIHLYPIKAPTVPAGQERVRIVIHAHNTEEQVLHLASLVQDTLQAMGLATPTVLSRL